MVERSGEVMDSVIKDAETCISPSSSLSSPTLSSSSLSSTVSSTEDECCCGLCPPKYHPSAHTTFPYPLLGS